MADRGDEIRTLLGEGQAALWLGESLILALLEANILDTDTILEAIDIVIAAKKAKAAEGSHPDVAGAAATQLASISASIAAAKTDAAQGRARRTRNARQKRST
jgi:hypothetical protein